MLVSRSVLQSSYPSILHRSTSFLTHYWSIPTSVCPSPLGQINRKTQRKTDGRKRETRCVFWFDGKRDLFVPGYDVCVVSVGAGDSVAFVEAASLPVGSAADTVACAAVTVTEAGGAVLEMGRRGATP